MGTERRRELMIYEFSNFKVDEERRELRLQGREVIMQPRVFDLLVYLIRNRKRVVGKDELLDALWPGVIVTEASLQRAVSLARSALREGDAEDAIRTYARQGYRFRAGLVREEVRARGQICLLIVFAIAQATKPSKNDDTGT